MQSDDVKPCQVSGAKAAGASRATRGVSIGLVDYGFDLLHPSLLRRSATPTERATSRVSGLLDQNTGVVFEREAGCMPAPHDAPHTMRHALGPLIEAALASGNRAALDQLYDPHAHYYDATAGRHGAHGTMMASIALAEHRLDPSVDLIAVQLALPEAGWREIDADGRPSWLAWDPARTPVWSGWRTYLESPALADAIDWIYEAACRRGDDGVIINLSLGTWAGAHDGRSRVEWKIAEVLARGEVGDGPVAAVVVPAGNAGADRGHASGDVRPGAPWQVTWMFEAGATCVEKLEIWYEAAQPLAVDIAVPGPAETAAVPVGPTAELRCGRGRFGVAEHRVAIGGRLSCVRLSVMPSLLEDDRGPVTVTLTAGDCDATARVHAWIERSGDGRARSWLSPHDPASTLGGLATAPGAIVVGALDTTAGMSPRPFAASGLGPHPWQGRDAVPHLWAPGHRIRAARSKHGDFTLTSGTSAACAAVAGSLAMCLADARTEAQHRGATVRTALRTALAAALDHPGAGEIRSQNRTSPPRQPETQRP